MFSPASRTPHKVSVRQIIVDKFRKTTDIVDHKINRKCCGLSCVFYFWVELVTRWLAHVLSTLHLCQFPRIPFLHKFLEQNFCFRHAQGFKLKFFLCRKDGFFLIDFPMSHSFPLSHSDTSLPISQPCFHLNFGQFDQMLNQIYYLKHPMMPICTGVSNAVRNTSLFVLRCLSSSLLKGYSNQWEIHTIYLHMYNILAVHSNRIILILMRQRRKPLMSLTHTRSFEHPTSVKWYLMYPVRRGLLTSQSQLLAKIPPIIAFF